jgi:sulfite reductase (NADPH) flavoprotein alpha-component
MKTHINKNHFFQAKIIKRDLLNKSGSEKKVYLIRFDIQNSGLHFSPGDSLAIIPKNYPELVNKTLKSLNANSSTTITHPQTKQLVSLEKYLMEECSITRPSLQILKLASHHSEIHQLLASEDEEKMKDFLKQFELWDFLKKYPIKHSIQEIIEQLSPLSKRYYSIASSQKQTPDFLEILISLVHYETNQHERFGICSHLLCMEAELNKTLVSVNIHIHPHFKLPKDPSKPIIMIGAGTGLAPYKAFLEERILTKAKGKNWLIFGEQRQKTDFYFEDYFSDLQNKNLLHLTTAFSRDQKEKIYVQNRLYEHKKMLMEWLEEGAYLYLCGDAKKMAKDVENTFLQILQEEKKLTLIEAKDFLKNLIKHKRFLKDVY